MGIYDRDYYQGEQHRYGGGASSAFGSMTFTTRLVILNVAIYLFGMFLEDKALMARWFGVTPGTLTRPWLWYQFVSYGFIHDPEGPNHLIVNMIGLWFFGRPVEQRLGRTEYLVFYFASLIFGGLVTSIHAYLFPTGLVVPRVIGASGAVTAVVLLFACYFPRARVLFMLFIPMPAWVLGVLLVAMNVMGQVRGGDHIAYDVHLAGAALAAAYYFGQIRLTRWMPFQWLGSIRRMKNPLRRRPKLRVHKPGPNEKLAVEADRILDKLHREGIEALTAKERKILEKYSREVRQKE